MSKEKSNFDKLQKISKNIIGTTGFENFEIIELPLSIHKKYYEYINNIKKKYKKIDDTTVNKIIKNTFENENINYLFAEKKLMTNIIFIFFLKYCIDKDTKNKNNCQTNFNKIKKIIEQEKYDQYKNIDKNINKNKLKNINKFGNIDNINKLNKSYVNYTPEELNKYISGLKSEKMNTNNKNINKNMNDTYRKRIKILKNKYTEKFISWLFNFSNYLIKLYNNDILNKLYNSIIKLDSTKLSKNSIELRDNLVKSKNNIDKIKSKSINKDNVAYLYNYFLIFGNFLDTLEIDNTDLYDKIRNKKSNKYVLPSNDMFNFNENILDLIKYLYESYNESEKYALPIKRNCANFDPLYNNIDTCYKYLLNRTYYFRSIISNSKNIGNTIDINNLLLQVGQKYKLKSIEELKTEKQSDLNKIKSFLKRLDEGYKERFVWISPDPDNLLIFMGNLQKNKITVKPICLESEYTTNILNISDKDYEVNIIRSGNNINIMCNITNTKKNLMEESIILSKDKNTILIKIDGKLRYNIIKIKENYVILNLCEKFKKNRIIYNMKNNKLVGCTISKVNTDEFVLGLLIGYIIRNNENMGKLFTNIGETITNRPPQCMGYTQ